MNKEIAEKWASALESGEYDQGRGLLVSLDGEKHCCLGVLNDVLGRDQDYHFEAGGIMTTEEETLFWKMNDLRGKSFKDIASYIREHYLS